MSAQRFASILRGSLHFDIIFHLPATRLENGTVDMTSDGKIYTDGRGEMPLERMWRTLSPKQITELAAYWILASGAFQRPFKPKTYYPVLGTLERILAAHEMNFPLFREGVMAPLFNCIVPGQGENPRTHELREGLARIRASRVPPLALSKCASACAAKLFQAGLARYGFGEFDFPPTESLETLYDDCTRVGFALGRPV